MKGKALMLAGVSPTAKLHQKEWDHFHWLITNVPRIHCVIARKTLAEKSVKFPQLLDFFHVGCWTRQSHRLLLRSKAVMIMAR